MSSVSYKTLLMSLHFCKHKESAVFLGTCWNWQDHCTHKNLKLALAYQAPALLRLRPHGLQSCLVNGSAKMPRIFFFLPNFFLSFFSFFPLTETPTTTKCSRRGWQIIEQRVPLCNKQHSEDSSGSMWGRFIIKSRTRHNDSNDGRKAPNVGSSWPNSWTKKH